MKTKKKINNADSKRQKKKKENKVKGICESEKKNNDENNFCILKILKDMNLKMNTRLSKNKSTKGMR